MLEINQELKNILSQTNEYLKESYIKNMDKEKIRESIKQNINPILNIKKSNTGQIEDLLGKNPTIVGVDGSTNKVGNMFPHYISLMQAVAKSTKKSLEPIELCDIYTPLIDKDYLDTDSNGKSLEEIDKKIASNKLAVLEMESAEIAISSLNPRLILMDGSLTRYYNADKSKFKQFIAKACLADVYVLGIIEEIKTAELGNRLNIKEIESLYDREILFGTLEENEMFVLKDWNVSGIKKCFLRTSKDPGVIGIDYMEINDNKIKKLCELVLTLTPENGRGIPFWLDIIDNDVKISDQMVKALIESYIDKDIIEKILTPKRNNRPL